MILLDKVNYLGELGFTGLTSAIKSNSPPLPVPPFATQVQSVRQFNRFYTRQIGVLNEGLLKSPFSLTEVRVLYELAHGDRPSASDIGKALGLDAGYLSRILKAFEKRGFVSRTPSRSDARLSHLQLTAKGRKTFAALDVRSNEEVSDVLRRLTGGQRRSLAGAMRTIQHSMSGGARVSRTTKAPYILRQHQPGDMGWVVHRHGILYSREYGWDERFEALVATIVADFIQKYDPARERCWIAERDGEIVGSVFLVKHPRKPSTVAKLRLLLVEPSARGLGIGAKLVDECIHFARLARYRKLMLWTNSVLHAARHIYERNGFKLVEEERHHSFGQKLVGQTWELTL